MIIKLLQDTGMKQFKPVRSPIEETRVANSTDLEALGKELHVMYRSIVGSLMYIATRTKRDLAVATNMLASCMNEPKMSHTVIAKSVLRYVNGTTTNMLVLKPGKEGQRTTYVDASWENQFEKGSRSRSGTLIMYGNAILAAKTRLQK